MIYEKMSNNKSSCDIVTCDWEGPFYYNYYNFTDEIKHTIFLVFNGFPIFSQPETPVFKVNLFVTLRNTSILLNFVQGKLTSASLNWVNSIKNVELFLFKNMCFFMQIIFPTESSIIHVLWLLIVLAYANPCD